MHNQSVHDTACVLAAFEVIQATLNQAIAHFGEFNFCNIKYVYSNVGVFYRDRICSNYFLCVRGNKKFVLFSLMPCCHNTQHQILLNDTAADIQRALDKMEFNFTSHFVLLRRASRALGSTLTWGELPLAWPDLPPGLPPSQGSRECLEQEKAAAVSRKCCALLSLEAKVPLLHRCKLAWFFIRGKHKTII